MRKEKLEPDYEFIQLKFTTFDDVNIQLSSQVDSYWKISCRIVSHVTSKSINTKIEIGTNTFLLFRFVWWCHFALFVSLACFDPVHVIHKLVQRRGWTVSFSLLLCTTKKWNQIAQIYSIAIYDVWWCQQLSTQVDSCWKTSCRNVSHFEINQQENWNRYEHIVAFSFCLIVPFWTLRFIGMFRSCSCY